MKPIQYAIIGGTGVYESNISSETIPVETEYGEVEIDIFELYGESIVFLPRHGRTHNTPPHLINYRANLKALQNIGVKHILSTAAVGSINSKIQVGSLVVMNDFLDMTYQRFKTFLEGDSKGVKHVMMDDPYCNNLREKLTETAQKMTINLNKDVVYVCTEGPRFETKAEIRMMSMLGADVVGMTNVPEVILAKELGMCYASVGIVVNMATGIDISSTNFGEIGNIVAEKKEQVNSLFLEIFRKSLDQKKCLCSDSILCL